MASVPVKNFLQGAILAVEAISSYVVLEQELAEELSAIRDEDRSARLKNIGKNAPGRARTYNLRFRRPSGSPKKPSVETRLKLAFYAEFGRNLSDFRSPHVSRFYREYESVPGIFGHFSDTSRTGLAM